MRLEHARYGENGPAVVIAHGLFGSARNWTSVARRLAGEGFRVFTPDLRNHGASPWSDIMTYAAMAEDLREFLAPLGSAAVIGHSMGGKAAMMLAVTRPELVARLAVVDIAPAPYGHSHMGFIEAMRAADLSSGRRAAVEAQLRQAVPEAPVRQFLLQNLVGEDGGLRWRINLDALADNMDALLGWPRLPEGASYGGPALFVAGEHSDYLRPEHNRPIRRLFPQATTVTVSGAGHWVHAERPERFLAELLPFLRR